MDSLIEPYKEGRQLEWVKNFTNFFVIYGLKVKIVLCHLLLGCVLAVAAS